MATTFSPLFRLQVAARSSLQNLTILYDGPSGATRDYWNWGIRVPWDSQGGDWLDASQSSQGPAPYASASASNGNRASLTITRLVQRWQTLGNTGLLLRPLSGSMQFATRETASPPTLTVTADSTQYLCRCTADSELNSSTYVSLGHLPHMGVMPGLNSVAQFDLSRIPARATITSAVLELRCVYGGGTVGVFELHAPPIWTVASEAPVSPQTGGIADRYAADNGIGGDPNTLFREQFGPSWTPTTSRTRWQFIIAVGGSQPYTTQQESALGNAYALSVDYAQDPARGGWDMRYHSFWVPQTEQEDVYHRAMVKWGDARIANQGEKSGVAIAGQYGARNLAASYPYDGWNHQDGNGGNRTEGVFYPRFVKVKTTVRAGAISITLQGFPRTTRTRPQGFFQIGAQIYRITDPSNTYTSDGNGDWVINGFSPPLVADAMAGSAVTGGWSGQDRGVQENGYAGYYSGWSARVHVWAGWAAVGRPVLGGNHLSGATLLACVTARDVPAVIRQGDRFKIGNGTTIYAYTGTASIASDANGNFTVPISPPLAQAHGGGENLINNSVYQRVLDADRNPYKDLVPLEVYFYNPQQATGYGTSSEEIINSRLSRDLLIGSRATGYPRLQLDTWHSVELRTKMNTVHGAPDVYGNQFANQDGIIQVWVDGVRVLNKTDAVFRLHPRIKIEIPAWIDWYVGGAEAPTVIQRTRRSVAGVVVATSYVGPMKV